MFGDMCINGNVPLSKYCKQASGATGISLSWTQCIHSVVNSALILSKARLGTFDFSETQSCDIL